LLANGIENTLVVNIKKNWKKIGEFVIKFLFGVEKKERNGLDS